MTQPTDRATRQAKRDGIRQRLIDHAELQAHRVARSVACGDSRHAVCAGALYCLCDCHDPSEDA